MFFLLDIGFLLTFLPSHKSVIDHHLGPWKLWFHTSSKLFSLHIFDAFEHLPQNFRIEMVKIMHDI